MREEKEKEEEKDKFELTKYSLPSIKSIVRQPSQLKIDYELLQNMCSKGHSITECAFAQATTPTVLDLKIRKDRKMTFHEFHGFYESCLIIATRDKLLYKALVKGHFASLQLLAINHLGMSKDGVIKKDNPSESGDYTTNELIEMLKGAKDEGFKGTKKDNKKCDGVSENRDVSGGLRPTGPRMHRNPECIPDTPGQHDKSGGGGEECKTTDKLRVTNPIGTSTKKIEETKQKVLEKIKQSEPTT